MRYGLGADDAAGLQLFLDYAWRANGGGWIF